MFQLFHQLLQLFFINFVHVCVYKLLEQVASHHVLNPKQSQSCPMIGNPVLRVVVGPDFLTSIHCPDLRLSSPGFCLYCLLVFHFEKFFFEQFGGSFSVLVLTAFLLNENAETGGNVGSSAGWICFLYWLTACSTGPCVLVFDIFIVDGEGEGNWGHDYHRNGRGVKSSFTLGFGDSNDLVDSWLAFHNFETVLAHNFELQIFVALRSHSLLDLTDDADSPALVLGVGDKHFADIFNENGRLRPPSAGPELKINLWDVIVCIGRNQQIHWRLFEGLLLLFETLYFILQNRLLFRVCGLLEHLFNVSDILDKMMGTLSIGESC